MLFGLNPLLIALLLIVFIIIIITILTKHSHYHSHKEDINPLVVQQYGQPQNTLYTNSKLFSLHQIIQISDKDDNVIYKAKSKVLSLHDKTWLYDNNDKQIAYIYRKLFTLHQRRIIIMNKGVSFQLSNELFHLIKDITNIEGLGWKLEGNILALNFTIKDKNENLLAYISSKYLSIHDKYSIDIYDTKYQDEIITIVISLQHMLKQRRAVSNNASNNSSASAN